MAKYKFGRELPEVEMSGESDRCSGIQLINAFEKAVYYFMENHLMDEMTGGCCNLSSQFVVGKTGFDIESESACIEIKVFMLSSDKRHNCLQERLHQRIKQSIEYVNSFSALLGEKRKILLVIGQEGICKEIGGLTNREAIMSLIRTVDTELELWVAEMKFEPTDGITLLSCRNIDNILLNEQYLQEGGEKSNG